MRKTKEGTSVVYHKFIAIIFTLIAQNNLILRILRYPYRYALLMKRKGQTYDWCKWEI